MGKSNAEHQAAYRKRVSDEKKRIEMLMNDFERPDIESRKKLLDKIKRGMRQVRVSEDGRIRAEDIYKTQNAYLIEGLEFLLISLKETTLLDEKNEMALIEQREKEKFKKRMAELRAGTLKSNRMYR